MLNLAAATAFTSKDLTTAIMRDPIAVSPAVIVREVIALMSGARSHCEADLTAQAESNHLHFEARSSCVVVVESQKVVGILTERDVVRLCANQQLVDEIPVRQIMTASVLTLREAALTDLFSAISMLQQNHIRHLPIINEQDCLVGLVTHETLRQVLQPSDLLRLRLVREVMTQTVITADPTDSLLAVAQRMANDRISSVVVVERHPPEAVPLPLGIVTERDLVQFQALGLDFERYHAAQVMSAPVVSVPQNETMVMVQQILERYLIRRVVVTGEAGELLGIVTQTDVLKALSPLELYKLTEVLEARVKQLETEKVSLLESRNLELETQIASRTQTLQKQLQREKIVAHLSTQIRSSLSLQSILETTVEHIHQMLGCDRVNIWKFEPDLSTVVVAESTNSSRSLMGERVRDQCYPQRITEVCREGHVRVVPDIYTTEMSDCHRELLISLQTRAKVLLPLFCGEQLWGLLNVSESQTARDWQADEVELLRNLANQLTIAIQQTSTHAQLQVELQERQQAEILLQIKNDLLARVAAQEPLTNILNHACTAIEGIQDGAMCSILLLDGNGRLRDGAAPSLPEHYRRHVDGVLVGEGVGSCGTAVHRRERVIVADIASDPLWQDVKDLALTSNLRACWSTPIVAGGGVVLGTFAIYYGEVRSPGADEMTLVDSLVPIVMLAIQRHQSEITLKQANLRLQEAQRIAHIGNWEQDHQRNTFYWSEEVFHILEIDPQQLGASYETFLGLVHPDDRTLVDEAYVNHLQSCHPTSLVHRLQMSDGRIKYVQEQWETTYSVDGTPLISRRTMQDMTQQKEAEIRRDRAEAALRQVVEGTAAVTDEAFFPALVRHISEALGVRYASIDQAMPDGFQVLAFFADGELSPPLFLPYDELPCCSKSFQTGSCCHPTGVQALYPGNALFNDLQVDSYVGVRLQNAAGDPIGNLCILHDAPLADPAWAQTLLTIFAARAGAELERLLTSQALEQLNAELEERVTQRTAMLAEREARYRGLMKGAADAIFLTNLQGHILDANEQAEALFGYPLAELTTMHFTQLHPDETLPKVRTNFAEIVQQQRSQVLDEIFLRADGTTVSVDITATVIDINGETVVQGIFRDISERKAIEQALEEARQFLQTVLDTVPLRVFWKDRESRYLGANARFLADAALASEADILGKNDFDMPWGATEAEVYRADDRSVMASGVAKLGVIETLHQQDGTKIWLETNRLPLRDLAGDVIGVLGTYQDITDRRNAEIALGRQLAAIEAAIDGIGILQDERYVYLNSSHVELLGYQSTQELLGQSWRILYSPETLDRFDQEIFPALHEQMFWQGEVIATRKNGTTFPQQLSLTLTADNLLICVCQDISDRKAAEVALRRTNAELERATRLKDEFLANMSHELRTPLNAILGMAEGLQEEVFGPITERQQHSLHTIERSGTHLLSLITDILDLSKIEANQLELEFVAVDVEMLCNSSLTFVKQQAYNKRLQIETQIPSHLPKLYGDERRLCQVLINLLTNAVKFTAEGGRITLSTTYISLPPEVGANHRAFVHPQGEWSATAGILSLAVADTGIGISPENAKKLFQPFVQVDSALNRQHQGTGLGLALVKRIAELHGGTVELISEVGVGSCFTLQLPVITIPSENFCAVDPTASVEALMALDYSIAPLILLAEDNEANINTTTAYLTAKGYCLIVARNGIEAVNQARTSSPDLILMDIQMPHLDGLEAIRQIRQMPGLTSVPIVALTALAMPDDRERCLAAGADEYISKPIRLKQLAQVMQTLLAKPSTA